MNITVFVSRYEVYPRFYSFFLYNSMGSIDEGALQNLNLVVNLTKHIHIKSSGSPDDIDCEEYSEYFPSFMWVVRDFTLQLVDSDDENINPNQYLEKALEEQKGFSDKIEEKNRIRRLLKSFFKERQWFTMIRPVTNEESLQNLEKMDERDFRPDFLNQVTQLRKKVTHWVKPKTLNGKELNPEMLISLAENYVLAINKGAVPNIENAWTYICQNESKKSLEKSVARLDQLINDEVIHRIPMEEKELKEIKSDIKKDWVSFFVKSCVGGVIEEYLDELKFQVRNKFDRIQEENEREWRNQCWQHLDFGLNELDEKLKTGQFNDFYEYENALKAFEEMFYNEGPPGPWRNECLLEFLYKCALEGVDYFIKQLSSKLELKEKMSEEEINRLESQVEELKRIRLTESEEFEQKIRKLSNDKAQLMAANQNLQDNLKHEQEEKTRLEAEYKTKTKKEKALFEKKLEDLKNKEEDFKEKETKMNLKYMSELNDYEKEKALYDQKISYLNQTIEELRQRESKTKRDQDEEKQELIKTARGKESKYERQINELREAKSMYEEQIAELQETIEAVKDQYNEKLRTLQFELSSKQDNEVCSSEEYLELKERLNNANEIKKQEIEEISNTHKEIQQQMTEKIVEGEQKYNELLSRYNSEKNMSEKEKAIYTQKLSFSQHEINELKSQLEKKKKEQESMLEIFGKNEKEISENEGLLQRKYNELRDQLEQKNEELIAELDLLKIKYDDDMTEAKQHIEQLERELHLSKSDYEWTIESLNEKVQKLQDETSQSARGMDNRSIQFYEEMEENLNQKVKKAEEETERFKAKQKQEIEKIQKESEELLMTVKSAYELEKHSLETRLKDFKQKESQKIHDLEEEHENELKELRIEYEDKCIELTDALSSMEASLSNHINNSSHEISLLKQKNESLEQILKDKAEQIANEKENNKKAMDEQVERYLSERKDMADKIDALTTELNIKEREFTQLKDRFSRLENEKKLRSDEIEEERVSLQKQRAEFEEQNKARVNRIIELESQNMANEQKHGTTIALLKQEIHFKDITIKEIKEKAEKDTSEYERKIKKNQEEYLGELDEKIESAVTAKEIAEKKFETTRSELNKLQIESRQRTSELEKELAIQAEKMKNYEKKIEEMKVTYEDEIENLKSKTGNQSGDYFKEKERLMKENDDLKSKYNRLDNDYSDLKNEMDKDTTLLNEKVKFLEDQLRGTKEDLKEQAKKFEMTLEQLNKKNTLERNKFDNGQQTLFDTIEQKYKSQIKEESDKFKKETRDLTQKNKELEKELRQVKEKLLSEQRDRKNMNSSAEKRIIEYQEIEDRLKAENTMLKTEYENKLRQYNSTYDQEKDAFKTKISDLEGKLIESENSKTKTMFHYEAEKSKLHHEIDSKCEKIDELQSKIALLSKENEKLKSNQRTSRKIPYAAERSSSNFAKQMSKPGFSSITNKFIKGQGSASSSISGSQKENADIHRTSITSKYISDNFGKTINFDQLTTTKSGYPLKKAENPNNMSYLQYESRDDDNDE